MRSLNRMVAEFARTEGSRDRFGRKRKRTLTDNIFGTTTAGRAGRIGGAALAGAGLAGLMLRKGKGKGIKGIASVSSSGKGIASVSSSGEKVASVSSSPRLYPEANKVYDSRVRLNTQRAISGSGSRPALPPGGGGRPPMLPSGGGRPPMLPSGGQPVGNVSKKKRIWNQ